MLKKEGALVNFMSFCPTLVLNGMDSSFVLCYTISMLNEKLYQAYHVTNFT